MQLTRDTSPLLADAGRHAAALYLSIAYRAGEKAKQYGHMSLRCALQQESWDPIFQGSPVFSQFSSLGSLDAKWLHQEFQLSLAAGNAAKDGQAHGEGTSLDGCQSGYLDLHNHKYRSSLRPIAVIACIPYHPIEPVKLSPLSRQCR